MQGGESATGAARLAAVAALRGGAGLVTLASPPQAAAVQRAGVARARVRGGAGGAAVEKLVDDPRVTRLRAGAGYNQVKETEPVDQR